MCQALYTWDHLSSSQQLYQVDVISPILQRRQLRLLEPRTMLSDSHCAWQRQLSLQTFSGPKAPSTTVTVCARAGMSLTGALTPLQPANGSPSLRAQ